MPDVPDAPDAPDAPEVPDRPVAPVPPPPDDAQRTWVDTMATAYEHHLVPTVFRPFALDLADRIARHRPTAVLELAAGTGVLTSELVDRLGEGGHVVATDLNGSMVRVGEQAAPRAQWRTADATDLPFDDDTFDVVAAQFGVMFFPDKVAAFADARRVLRPGGWLIANVWGDLDDHGLQAPVVEAFRTLGRTRAASFFEDVVHGYHDPDRITADLAAAGFAVAPTFEEVVLTSPPATAADVARGYCRGTPALADVDPAEHGAVEAAVEAALAARLGGDDHHDDDDGGDATITAPMSALVVTARADG